MFCHSCILFLLTVCFAQVLPSIFVSFTWFIPSCQAQSSCLKRSRRTMNSAGGTSSNGGDHLGIMLAALSMCIWQYYRSQQNAQKLEKAYWAERRGRARVEKEMKRISNIQLNTDEGFFVQPIGEIESCYRQCVGTPRQGLLAPSSRATIKLNTHISPESLVGLETFSHVWITFKFHLNTNTLKESKNFSNRSTFNAKITLPMLKKKLGVFATRSPHRPNPVGVTLAKIDRFDKQARTVYLSGCDLVQGTPVLDVKPYVPAYDTVPAEESRIPEWIEDTVYTRNTVNIAPHCAAFVRAMQARLVQYKNAPEEYLNGLRETLEAEVRSKFQTSRRMSNATQGEPVEVPFDETIVKYYWVEERVFDVVEIEMRQKNKGLLIEKAVLTAVEIADAADAEVDIPVLLQAISQQQQGAEEVDEGESSGSADEGKTWKVVMEEGEEQVFEEGAY